MSLVQKGPNRRTPVFLIQPISNLKHDIGGLKEILLNLGAEVTLVSKHPALMIFPIRSRVDIAATP